MITRTFKLCLNAGTGSAPFINVSQTDKDEVWLFELYTETGERYIPSSGAIIGIKADGHGIANTGTVDSEGRVVITETEQMTAAAGRSIFELSIDGLTHGTANFIVNVEKKPIDGAIMSDSDLSLISQAVDSAAVIVDVIGDGDPSEVIGEHVDAWLDNHPEATTTVQDGAITAPKINQSLWDKLLVSEEASGAVASFDDGADDVPVSSLKVALEPIQLGSGDPSPTNIRPIYPANGKNLFDEANATVHTRYIDATSWRYSADSASYAFPCSPSTQYTVTAFNTNLTIFRIGCLNEAFDPSSTATLALTHVTRLTSASSITVTTDAETQYIVIQVNGTLANNAMIQIELGSASPFQPYQGIMVERCGKNLLPQYGLSSDTKYGITLTNDNGEYTLNGTATTRASFDITVSLPSGTYTLVAFNTALAGSAIYVMNSAGTVLQNIALTKANKSQTFTVSDNIALIRITVANGSVLTNGKLSPMIVIGETPSVYEPYIGTSYPVSLGREVYGGSVDLATGVLTVTHQLVDMGSLTWNRTTSYAHPVFYVQINEKGTKYEGAMSSAFRNISSSSIGAAGTFANASNDGDFACSANNAQIFVRCDQYTTPADFKTAVTGYTLVYPLTTPQTIQLTPTQIATALGYNNISSTGTVDVIYHADTKLYVDKMTNVDNAIIAPTEETFTATRNYTVNDLLIVADTLYKVTANIANGGTITPNSNVQQTTLGALIKALS